MKKLGCKSFFGFFLTVSFLLSLFIASSFADKIPYYVPKTFDPNKKVDQHGDVIVVVGSSSFLQKGGDPATHSSGTPYTNHTVFGGLTWSNHLRHPVPNICYKWDIDPAWKNMTFYLRDDIKFHNGELVTAEDVKFSIDTNLRKDLKFVYGGTFRRLFERGEVLGPHKFRLHLKTPAQGIEHRFSWGAGVYPKKYRETVGDDGFADKPIGTGPFKWVDYKQDQWFQLESVKVHHRKTPTIKTLKFVFVPENSTRLAMLKTREGDIVHLAPPHVPAALKLKNVQVKFTRFVSGSVLIYADLAFPDIPSPFKDIRVREAASLAIDRKAICEKILFGVAEPYGEQISGISLGYDSTVKPDPYDPERAKALLKEAGYPNGFDTTLNVTTTDLTAQAIAANLLEVGIKAKLNVLEAGTWVKSYRVKKFKGLIPGVSWYGAEKSGVADAISNNMRGSRWTYYVPDDVNDAIMEGLTKISSLAVGLGPKIKFYQPQMGGLPPSLYEFIEINR
jgi:peptide/nickel transport system substrate-binding protein